MISWLEGKKTMIGSLLLSLLGAFWTLDLLIDGSATWLSEAQYYALGTTIAGLTGAAMRLAIGKKTTY